MVIHSRLILSCILLLNSSSLGGFLHDFFHKPQAIAKRSTNSDSELAATLKAAASSSQERVIVVNYNKLGNKKEQKTTVTSTNNTDKKIPEENKIKSETTFAQPLLEWVHTHKLRCFLYALGTSYLCLQGYLWYLSLQLSQSTLWSQWYQEKTLEDLYKIPDADLIQSLLTDIRLKYLHRFTSEDRTSQLTQFMQDIQKELDLLQSYQKITQMLSNFVIRKLFFFNATFLESIPARLHRIYYLREKLLSWQRKQQS